MENLEEILKQVESLGRDLSAEIVVQVGEIGFWTEVGRDYNQVQGEDVWVPGKPDITEPDVQKREAARQQLQQTYDTSDWYSARYMAGKALRTNVNSQVIDWVEKLTSIVNDHPRAKYVKVGEHEEYEDIQYWDHRWYKMPTGTVEDFGYVPIPENIEINDNAREDLKKLYDLTVRTLPGKLRKATGRVLGLGGLRVAETEMTHNGQLEEHELEEIYEYSKNKRFRSQAGKELGYNSIRIWVHENPNKKTMGVLAAAGAVSGIGYMIYQFLAR